MSGDGRLIVLVRHPETRANVEHRFIGREDSPLTARGYAQIPWITEVVRASSPAVVYSSPLARAHVTAEAIAGSSHGVRLMDELAEVDFGRAAGHTWQELEATGMTPDYSGSGPIAPGGETADAFDARVRAAAALIGHERGPVVVVTHGGVLRRLLVVFLELPTEAGWRFDLPNAVIARVRLHSHGGVLEALVPPTV
ncbi:MAG: histidine phosphatase family protein [Aeromicrobium sp.]|nr:histidine phosphatase family protein [Aeromicrobium sp.]